MATVAGIDHIDRHRRSAQTVARQFAPLHWFQLTASRPQAAWVRSGGASLEKPMKAVIENRFAEGLRRDPEQQPHGYVVDGDPTPIDSSKSGQSPWGERRHYFRRHSRTGISLEAAKVRFTPDDPQAAPWVAEQIEGLLHGQVRSIVSNLRCWATVQGFEPETARTLDQCTTLLANHLPFLRRKSGSPVAMDYPWPWEIRIAEGRSDWPGRSCIDRWFRVFRAQSCTVAQQRKLLTMLRTCPMQQASICSATHGAAGDRSGVNRTLAALPEIFQCVYDVENNDDAHPMALAAF